jgi:hypothetical protein
MPSQGGQHGQRGQRGGRGHHGRRGRRGAPRWGHYRGRNDFYVGRVSLPPVEIQHFLPRKPDPNQRRCDLTSWKSPIDFFIPSVYRNPVLDAFSSEEGSDTCTTWRGLSSVGAEELFIWTNLYQTVLKQRIEFGDYSVDLSSIVGEMVERYEERPPAGFNWFMSAPNIYQRVEKFLSISTETPSLQVEEYEAPVVGKEYTLAPRVLSITDNPSDGFAREMIFSTSVDWMSFDASCNAFVGIVPSAPPRHIVVKAKVIEYLDEHVRLEHVVRARVKLRSRAGISANNYLAELFNVPVFNGKIVRNDAKPKKQVSFAEDLETDSLHSSPDHLRTFFNELAALTCDPTYDDSSEEPAFGTAPPCDAISSGDDTIAGPAVFLGRKALGGDSEDSTIRENSQDTAVSPGSDLKRHRLASVNSSGQLYSRFRHPHFESADAPCEDTKLRPDSGLDRMKSQNRGLDTRHRCARDSSCGGGGHKANRTGNKPRSILDDFDGNLHLEVALGLSDPKCDSGFHPPRAHRPTSLGFWNSFGSLSKCSDMDRPTQACESTAGSETGSQRSTLKVSSSQTVSNIEGMEGPWKNSYRWNWRGWEREIGVMKRSHTNKSGSDVSRESSGSSVPSSCLETGFGTRPHMREVLENHYRSDHEKDREAASAREFNLGGDILSPTSSSANTDTRSRKSSEESWIIEGNRTVFKEASNSANTSATLYDTVRYQFYNDYKMRTRQMSSPRHSKSSSGGVGLTSLFSNDSCHQEQAGKGPDVVKNIAFPPKSEDATPTAVGPDTLKGTPSHADLTPLDDEPDVGIIAAAVKDSLAVEIQGKDRREKAEIRKGILHHQVMELQRSERRRQFGSSNYDDVFLSSDGGSTDDKSSTGLK